MQPVVQVFKVNTSKCRNPILSSGNTKSRLANNLTFYLPSVLNQAILLIANGSESWESTGSTARSLAYSRIDYSKKFQKPQSMWRKSRDRGWLRRLFTKAHLFIHCAQKKRIQLSGLKNAQSFSICSFNFTFERETSMPLHFLHFEKRNRGE